MEITSKQASDIKLPQETNKIAYNIDTIYKSTEGFQGLHIIRGWAFVKDDKSDNHKMYVVLKSAKNTYIFDAVCDKRPDVSEAFGLSLDNSGFQALIPENDIQKEIYQVGLLIKSQNDQYITFSNNYKIDNVNFFKDTASLKTCFSHLPDDLWLTLLTKPDGFLPLLPSEDTQLRFTGLADINTMKQAFAFYNVIKGTCNKQNKPLSSMNAILDFGCGWGRITRFFLRDVDPGVMHGSDCIDEMVELCKNTNKWAKFSVNNINPPTNFESSKFDLIYAYSVFSHLSEKSHRAWIEEFHRILQPGGFLIVTTRERDFISNLAKPPYSLDMEINITEALSNYDQGHYCYFPTGGGFVLDSEFYGEACIPETYVKNNWTDLFKIEAFIVNENGIDQNIIVARKK